MSSSTFSTTYGDNVLVLGSNVVVGTAMLGDDFGTVKSCSVKRAADKEEIENAAGNLRAVLLKKPGFEMTLEVAFEATVTAPALGAAISLPLVGVVGRVMPGVEVKWEGGKERGLSIPVSSWDSLENASLYQVDPVTQEYTLLDIGTPVPTATAGSGQIVIDWPDISGATGHDVQASSDSGVTFTTVNSPASSTYTHTVTTGQTRHYRVRAKNAKGNGPWSATVNATAGA